MSEPDEFDPTYDAQLEDEPDPAARRIHSRVAWNLAEAAIAAVKGATGPTAAGVAMLRWLALNTSMGNPLTREHGLKQLADAIEAQAEQNRTTLF